MNKLPPNSQVNIRHTCSHCNGSGKSGLNYAEAALRARSMPFTLGESMSQVTKLLRCEHCNGEGWQYQWVDLTLSPDGSAC